VTELALGALRNAEPSLSVASVAESIVMRAPQVVSLSLSLIYEAFSYSYMRP